MCGGVHVSLNGLLCYINEFAAALFTTAHVCEAIMHKLIICGQAECKTKDLAYRLKSSQSVKV